MTITSCFKMVDKNTDKNLLAAYLRFWRIDMNPVDSRIYFCMNFAIYRFTSKHSLSLPHLLGRFTSIRTFVTKIYAVFAFGSSYKARKIHIALLPKIYKVI